MSIFTVGPCAVFGCECRFTFITFKRVCSIPKPQNAFLLSSLDYVLEQRRSMTTEEVYDLNYFEDPLIEFHKPRLPLLECATNKGSCYIMFTVLSAALKFHIHCFGDLQLGTLF